MATNEERGAINAYQFTTKQVAQRDDNVEIHVGYWPNDQEFGPSIELMIDDDTGHSRIELKLEDAKALVDAMQDALEDWD